MEKFRDSQVLGWQLCSRKFSKSKATSNLLLCHAQYMSQVLRVQDCSKGLPHYICVLESGMKYYMQNKRRQKAVQQLPLKEGSRNCHMTLVLTFNWPKLNLISHQAARHYRKMCLSSFYLNGDPLSLNISRHRDLCSQYQKVSMDTNLVL